MPDRISDLANEFHNLVKEGADFFAGVGYATIRSDITSKDNGFDWEWENLPDEQQAKATDLRHRLRLLLARFAKPFQESPLLDKQDFRKFVRLGRAMDAALRFQSFHNVCIYESEDDPGAHGVFVEASERLGELLDLIPEQACPSAVADTSSASTEEHGTAQDTVPSGSSPSPTGN